MEGLIIFIIIGIISSLLKKGKEQQSTKQQMPPFNKDAQLPKSRQTRSQTKQIPNVERPILQSFEDFAKEFVGEIKQASAQPKAQSKPIVVEQAKVVEEAPKNEQRESMKERFAERNNSRGQMNVKHVQNRTSNSPIVQPSRNTLVQAIIMAEVLGPPKAKQKRS